MLVEAEAGEAEVAKPQGEWNYTCENQKERIGGVYHVPLRIMQR
jgi:hypothetical protein